MSLPIYQILLTPPWRPRPLASMDHAKCLLDIEEPQVLALLDCGRLMFGFDLHTPGAHQPCLRIYTPCLVAYLEHQPQPEDLEAVIRDILPKPWHPVLRATTLQRCFNVTSNLIHGLVNAGAFKVLRPPHRGCGGCALLDRVSVEEFLRKRRYC